MNARVKVVSGSFSIVGEIGAEKIDELAKLLGISDEDKASLKGGNGLIVIGPLGKDATG